jgi:N-acyl homoserine lactone hydrolase
MTDDHQGVHVEVLRTAEIPMPYHYIFRAEGGRITQLRAGLSKKGTMLRSPCLAYVVRHPAAGVLLIDTGFHPDARTNLRKDFGLAMSLLFKDIEPMRAPFTDQLRSVGVEPEQVRRVVMTHLHVDHTSGMRMLPNATFVCTRQEWAAAHGRFAAVNGYVSHHLPPESRVELVDLDSHGNPYAGFEETIDLLGDGSIRLVFTPGHTPGHTSVLLRLDGGGEVLVVGDATYTVRSIREQLLPMLTADDQASRSSLRQLCAFIRHHPNAIVVPTHDPDAWRQLTDPTQAAHPARRSPTRGVPSERI